MFLLDSNTFIEASNRYYRSSICPGYWDFIESRFLIGDLASTRSVFNELEGFGDGLSEWVKERKDFFLDESDSKCLECFSQISQFVMDHGTYAQIQKERFLAKADPLIIAMAKSLGARLVTHEVPVNGNSSKVKIPNICKEFQVEVLDTFDLLELLEVKFHMR